MVEWADRPFVSQVKWSKLVIEAPMKELYIGLDDNENYIVREVADTESTPSTSSAINFIPDNDDEDEDYILFKIFPCLLARTQITERNKADCSNVFLILEAVSEPVEGESYRRIGIGAYWNRAFNFDCTARRTIYLT
jgi:hypothetical protein